ncbi:hypothetical protein [Streptomyces sp. NBC_00024]|uniref:hypothetical protein n=1 Tax=Streptomyces sp. NBC_00024 TaxID=2903612 RepID=UPI003866DED1
MTIRVVLVDDQDMVRSVFAVLPAAQGDIDVMGEAAYGRRGVEASRPPYAPRRGADGHVCAAVPVRGSPARTLV